MDGECHHEVPNFQRTAEAMDPSRLGRSIGYRRKISAYFLDIPSITCDPASRGVSARRAIKGNIVYSLSNVGGGRRRERKIGDGHGRGVSVNCWSRIRVSNRSGLVCYRVETCGDRKIAEPIFHYLVGYREEETTATDGAVKLRRSRVGPPLIVIDATASTYLTIEGTRNLGER